jgi:hypothetical protein
MKSAADKHSQKASLLGLYETLSRGRANPTNDIAFIQSLFFKKPVLK